MRTLFLHIGFHKTGSSALQLALKQSTKLLSSKGIEFLSLGKKGSSSRTVDFQKKNGRMSYRLNRRLSDLLASSRGDNVVVSAEHLCFLHTFEDIDSLYKECRRFFDRCQVVVYLRRQDLQAFSFKRQAARAAAPDVSPSSLLFGHCEGAFPHLNTDLMVYFDYFSKLKIWAAVFGGTALNVRDFSAEFLREGDVVSDFCSLLGVNFCIPSVRVNEGVGRKEFLLTNKLIELGVSKSEIKKIKPMMRLEVSEPFPAKVEAERFFRRFECCNKSLNSHFLKHSSGLAFSDDFSGYPEEGNDYLTLQDLSSWLPQILSAGVRHPQQLRDALLRESLQSLMGEYLENPLLLRELEGIMRCLSPVIKDKPVDVPRLWSLRS
ncbi:hypothetical protein [Microbulbifer variabilis]|uniref:Uncharacterized protein n=1 Tax=Microbulbifer variabilis TaxID=266805 RepID=A0ABY4V8M2_9GAMM|nr:hypothetical protein [Microbulbifer variabilis]USD20609.1 hypothetical protein MJO52_16230 [Microbulbifer variabilis]